MCLLQTRNEFTEHAKRICYKREMHVIVSDRYCSYIIEAGIQNGSALRPSQHAEQWESGRCDRSHIGGGDIANGIEHVWQNRNLLNATVHVPCPVSTHMILWPRFLTSHFSLVRGANKK